MNERMITIGMVEKTTDANGTTTVHITTTPEAVEEFKITPLDLTIASGKTTRAFDFKQKDGSSLVYTFTNNCKELLTDIFDFTELVVDVYDANHNNVLSRYVSTVKRDDEDFIRYTGCDLSKRYQPFHAMRVSPKRYNKFRDRKNTPVAVTKLDKCATQYPFYGPVFKVANEYITYKVMTSPYTDALYFLHETYSRNDAGYDYFTSELYTSQNERIQLSSASSNGWSSVTKFTGDVGCNCSIGRLFEVHLDEPEYNEDAKAEAHTTDSTMFRDCVRTLNHFTDEEGIYNIVFKSVTTTSGNIADIVGIDHGPTGLAAHTHGYTINCKKYDDHTAYVFNMSSNNNNDDVMHTRNRTIYNVYKSTDENGYTTTRYRVEEKEISGTVNPGVVTGRTSKTVSILIGEGNNELTAKLYTASLEDANNVCGETVIKEYKLVNTDERTTTLTIAVNADQYDSYYCTKTDIGYDNTVPGFIHDFTEYSYAQDIDAIIAAFVGDTDDEEIVDLFELFWKFDDITKMLEKETILSKDDNHRLCLFNDTLMNNTMHVYYKMYRVPFNRFDTVGGNEHATPDVVVKAAFEQIPKMLKELKKPTC